jgi:hypothetical protein
MSLVDYWWTRGIVLIRPATSVRQPLDRPGRSGGGGEQIRDVVPEARRVDLLDDGRVGLQPVDAWLRSSSRVTIAGSGAEHSCPDVVAVTAKADGGSSRTANPIGGTRAPDAGGAETADGGSSSVHPRNDLGQR